MQLTCNSPIGRVHPLHGVSPVSWPSMSQIHATVDVTARHPDTADSMDDHPLSDPRTPRTVICDCCELSNPERLSSAVRNPHGLIRGWICRTCNEHRADPLKKAQDHEYEVRVRWGETVDKWHAAEDRADDYREKMLAAFKSRDNVLRQFEKLSRYHRATDHGCICRQPNCKTLAIIDADWINDHIARMHERDAV